MEWQETYFLYKDNTFKKSRTKEQIVTEVTGSYLWHTATDGQRQLVLRYAFDNDLIGNCSAEAKESLRMNTQGNLVNSWEECDGPRLIYRQQK
jgi:hypothetical protein